MNRPLTAAMLPLCLLTATLSCLGQTDEPATQGPADGQEIVSPEIENDREDERRYMETLKRSMAGDREAMILVIRDTLEHTVETPLCPDKWPGVPKDVDQVALVMEWLSRPPQDEHDRDVRGFATDWLALKGDERAGPFLAHLAEDESVYVMTRICTLRGLARFPAAAVPVFQRLASHADRQVRIGVADYSMGLKDVAAKGILQGLCSDADYVVRCTAARSLNFWSANVAPKMDKSRGEPPHPGGPSADTSNGSSDTGQPRTQPTPTGRHVSTPQGTPPVAPGTGEQGQILLLKILLVTASGLLGVLSLWKLLRRT